MMFFILSSRFHSLFKNVYNYNSNNNDYDYYYVSQRSHKKNLDLLFFFRENLPKYKTQQIKSSQVIN